MGNQCKILANEEIDSENLDIFKKEFPQNNKYNDAIEEIRKTIMNIPIFERDKIAEKKYKDYLKIKSNKSINLDFFEEYIKIIELLLYDETNKNIVSLYLDFIIDNEVTIKTEGLKTFSEVINKYKLIFTIDEMKEKENRINTKNIKTKCEKNKFIEVKTKSEKRKFIEFLETLKDINELNYDDIYNIAEKENIHYFNFPISFSNQELFYYKLYLLIIMEIKTIRNNIALSNELKKEYILERSKVANLVLKERVLENNYIINSEDKMNMLIILILYDKLDNKEESINFNRLLQIKNVDYTTLSNYINNNNIGKLYPTEKQNEFLLEKYCDEIIKVDINEICLKNLSKDLRIKKIYNEYIYNTFDSIYKKNDIIPYIDKIRQFLKFIVNSRVYKEAITQLFPKDYDYLLNLKNIETCIDSRLKIYPYEDLGNSGLTDKFSCCSYIPIIFTGSLDSPELIIFELPLKIGSVIENSIHEINHLNQDILFLRGCDEKLFFSPKRHNLKGDGGQHLEELLFKKKIETISIVECFYILNEDNYNQSLNDFKTNFINLMNEEIPFPKKKRYITNNKNEAIFKDFFALINNCEEKEFKLRLFKGMNAKNSNKKYYNLFKPLLIMPKYHCKMGIYPD